MIRAFRVLLVIAFGGIALADPRVNVEPAPSPKAIAAAKQIVDEALVAKGGRQRLAAIKSMQMLGGGTTEFVPGTHAVFTLERVLVLPDKIRIDASVIPTGQGIIHVKAAVDGAKGWQRDGAKPATDLSKTDLADFDFERWRDPEFILLRASDKDAKVASSPDEQLDGIPQAVVKLRAPSGVEVKLYFDRQTRLLSRMAYADNKCDTVEDLSDYRNVKGIQIAHKRNSTSIAIRRRSAVGATARPRTTTLDFTSVVIDPVIDPKVFRKP